MESKTMIWASSIGAVIMAYVAMLIFRFDLFSIYTLFFLVVGAGLGILIAYKAKFR